MLSITDRLIKYLGGFTLGERNSMAKELLDTRVVVQKLKVKLKKVTSSPKRR